MEIDRGTGPAVWTNHGDAIYVNADKCAIVPGDSPEAAFLLSRGGRHAADRGGAEIRSDRQSAAGARPRAIEAGAAAGGG